MKTRIWILMSATLLFLMAGCDFGVFTRPAGMPTVTVTVGDVNLDSEALTFTINAYVIPGSPSGTIRKYTLSDGTEIAGPRLNSCAPGGEACGPYKTNVSIKPPPSQANLSIVSYTAEGDASCIYTQEFVTPIPIY